MNKRFIGIRVFVSGIWKLLLAILVSVIILPVGLVYNVGYGVWVVAYHRRVSNLFRFIWKLVDGIFYCVGYLLEKVVVFLDMLWNVNGEVLEDIVTTEESTTFGEGGITVSASIGKLEDSKKLTDMGKRISRILNWVFRQRCHCVGSWRLHLYWKYMSDRVFNVGCEGLGSVGSGNWKVGYKGKNKKQER